MFLQSRGRGPHLWKDIRAVLHSTGTSVAEFIRLVGDYQLSQSAGSAMKQAWRVLRLAEGAAQRRGEGLDDFLLDLLTSPSAEQMAHLLKPPEEERLFTPLVAALPGINIMELPGVFIPDDVSVGGLAEQGAYAYCMPDAVPTKGSIRRGFQRLCVAFFPEELSGFEISRRVMASGRCYTTAVLEQLLAVGAHPDHCDLQLERRIWCLDELPGENGPRVPVLTSYRFNIPDSSGIQHRLLMLKPHARLLQPGKDGVLISAA